MAWEIIQGSNKEDYRKKRDGVARHAETRVIRKERKWENIEENKRRGKRRISTKRVHKETKEK